MIDSSIETELRNVRGLQAWRWAEVNLDREAGRGEEHERVRARALQLGDLRGDVGSVVS